jgi:alpha-beta hydrolase superfamily lysophospholipase
MDHGGNYLMPGLYFKEKGIATLAYDQHGHDRQRKVYIPRFEVFLDDLGLMLIWVKENFPGLPIFILSHSMGGLISTHYGLTRLDHDSQVRGFITSSPYYVNAIKTPKILEKLAGLLSALTPRMAIPLEDITGNLTHDEQIYLRHRTDEKDGIMATLASARFANELLKAQRWIPEKIAEWKHPMLAIVAGEDKVADTGATRILLKKIDPELITELYYPENFHENLNELNRDEIFAQILEWVEARI